MGGEAEDLRAVLEAPREVDDDVLHIGKRVPDHLPTHLRDRLQGVRVLVGHAEHRATQAAQSTPRSAKTANGAQKNDSADATRRTPKRSCPRVALGEPAGDPLRTSRGGAKVAVGENGGDIRRLAKKKKKGGKKRVDRAQDAEITNRDHPAALHADDVRATHVGPGSRTPWRRAGRRASRPPTCPPWRRRRSERNVHGHGAEAEVRGRAPTAHVAGEEHAGGECRHRPRRRCRARGSTGS